MDAKVNEWRPGPNVCRCCLTEGCYKDISTEYFWMGKREVYAEMLSETFDLTIAYSKSGGPNSNSRLICENCIARLRDATDFKRQVKECEKTFIQHLDPGNNVPADIELRLEPQDDKTVKLESVKLEKRHSDDDFDDRNDFATTLDDDDDDLDDEPLLKLASKTPKKETENVDILDLLDNAKVTEKRKSSTRSKEPPTKKLKKKEPLPKPSASKNLTTEKKKKGVRIKTQELVKSFAAAAGKLPKATLRSRKLEEEKHNITTILECSNAVPFRCGKGKFVCGVCPLGFTDVSEMRAHIAGHKSKLATLKHVRSNKLVKIEISHLKCKICDGSFNDFTSFKRHLVEEHAKHLYERNGDGFIPFRLIDGYNCVFCDESFQFFLMLNRHMNTHYVSHVCSVCGKGFLDRNRLITHMTMHEKGRFACTKCEMVFDTVNRRHVHVINVHRPKDRYKCPRCDLKFTSHNVRHRHLRDVHGENILHRCPLCSASFSSSSSRSMHVRLVHAKNREHCCTYCPARFGTSWLLKNHIVIHTGKKEFQCQVCKKAYARRKTLTEHMKIHTNDRRFVCSMCSKSFVQKCSLKQHFRVHHPNTVIAKEDVCKTK